MRRDTPRSVTLMLAPNDAFTDADSQAGQYVNLTVEIDGRRHTRCYSPANAEGAAHLELTIGRHDGGLVSTYLYEHARRGMVVGLDRRRRRLRPAGAAAPRASCSSPAAAASRRCMAMLRTLVNEGHRRRDRLRPLRAQRAPRPATATSWPRCPVSGCCTATPGRPAATSTAASAPSTWRPPCRNPTRSSSAVQRLWSRPSASTARTCASESFVPPVVRRAGRTVRRTGHVRGQRH